MKRSRFRRIRNACAFVQQQSIRLRIVSENLRVSAPIQSRVELESNVFLRKVLVQDVAKKLQRNRPVGLPLQRVSNLLNQRDVTKNSVAKQFLSRADICVRKFLARWSNLHVSLSRIGESQQHSLIHDRKQIIHFHQQLFREMIHVLPSAAIVQELEQSSHPARS